MLNKLKSISKIQILALVLIIIGLGLVIRYGIGAYNAYRTMEYARVNNFEAGNPDPDLIRPWMSMRYVAVAYTVPQEYLFFELGIPMERRNSEVPLDDLNEEFKFGRLEGGDGRPHLVIMDKLKEAISSYRENPVPTGLREGGVRPWMNVQYIANSTGIPAEYIFEQLGLPMDGYAYMLLDRLSDETHYPGGPKALFDHLQQIVDTYEAEK
jgi:hypothetical protein